MSDATYSATEVPVEPSNPASDPQPAETPVMPESPMQTPQPSETPVIETPADPGEIVDTTSHGASVPPAQATQAPALSSASASTAISIKDRLSSALEKIRFRKRAKLDRIVELAHKKGRIKNDDVEKLLRVSDATASRYLLQLVKEGNLRQVGNRGGAWYEPI